MRYEAEADVLSWELGTGAIDYAEEAGNMVVHFSKKNVPVYVELLNASKFFAQTDKLINKAITGRQVLAVA